jgi:hypothetical protein
MLEIFWEGLPQIQILDMSRPLESSYSVLISIAIRERTPSDTYLRRYEEV